ncbi:MAG: GNAT family protein [Lachnospiraceae bacterium]|nr:GNAT family protein [Lachnospiraceae bacterium]
MKIEEKKFEIDGHMLLLRNAREEEAQMLLDYLKTACGETRYLSKEPEEIKMTLEEERGFIKSQNESDNNLMLIGFWDGEYVGNCSFMGSDMMRYRHRASMGIALYQKFTGLGIGKIMVRELCDIAKNHGFEQMELEVVADNERAIGLYKKMGFEIYGTFPRNMKYPDGTYADAHWMMKLL